VARRREERREQAGQQAQGPTKDDDGARRSDQQRRGVAGGAGAKRAGNWWRPGLATARAVIRWARGATATQEMTSAATAPPMATAITNPACLRVARDFSTPWVMKRVKAASG
jgi:hypothetical protein